MDPITKRVKIQFRLPQELNDAVGRQAAASKNSMNFLAVTTVVARYFAARASRTTPLRAKGLLKRMWSGGLVRQDDRIELDETGG